MSNPDAQKSIGGKTLCVFSNKIYSFQHVDKGACPYSKTFDMKNSNY